MFTSDLEIKKYFIHYCSFLAKILQPIVNTYHLNIKEILTLKIGNVETRPKGPGWKS